MGDEPAEIPEIGGPQLIIHNDPPGMTEADHVLNGGPCPCGPKVVSCVEAAWREAAKERYLS